MKTLRLVQDFFIAKKTLGLVFAFISVFFACATCYLAGAYLENGTSSALKIALCVVAFILCGLSCLVQAIVWMSDPRIKYGKLEVNLFVQLLCIDMVALFLCFAIYGPIGFNNPKSFVAVSQLAPGAFIFLFLLVSALVLVAIRAKAYLTSNKTLISPDQTRVHDPFLPWFLIIYFLLLIAPYSFAPIPSINSFLTGYGKIPYRLGCLALLVTYSVYLLIRYKMRPKYELLFPFALLVVSGMISCVFSPRNILYVGENLNGSFTINQTALSENSIWLELVMLLVDCFVLFCFLSFVAPCVSDKKTMLLVMLTIGIYALLSCFYSYVVEYNAYVSFLNGSSQVKGAIRSWSQSKNSFGIILVFGAFAFAFISSLISSKYRWVCLVPILVFLATSYIAQCNSALVVLLFVFLVVSAQLFGGLFRRSRVVFWSVLSAILLCMAALIFCASSPMVYEHVPFFQRVNAKVNLLFSSEILTRTEKWTRALVVIKGPYAFVGKLGSSGPELTAYESINRVAAANYDYHSAFVGCLASTGLIGLLVYLFFMGFAIKQVWLTWFANKKLCFVAAGLLLSAVLFSMPETYSLFLSASVISLPFTYAFLLFLPALRRMEA